MEKKNEQSKPIVGSSVYAAEQGLGYLAKDFYDNGVIDVVAIQKHTSRTTHYGWYPDRVSVEDLIDQCDVLLFFETVFNWKIMQLAKKKGVKTIMMPMYECTQYPFPTKFDKLVCPSLLDMDYYPKEDKVFLNVPIPSWIKWKERKKAKVFVHNSGNGGLGMRNGTLELIKAMEYVKSPIKLIIRSQAHKFYSKDSRITFINEHVSRETLYEGDVFIFPEKFNGLSLPLQEAYASGMAVMATDRHPMNTWLPNDLLIEQDKIDVQTLARPVDVAIVNPKKIAQMIDNWYGKDITEFSNGGKEFCEKLSWKNMKQEYLNLIQSVWQEK